jgi:predicted ester cyclase
LPGWYLVYGAHYALTGTDAIYNGQLAMTLTVLVGAELGVAEACLYTLLGVMLLGGARSRAVLRQAEENRKKALRLYEVGLGKNDPSVVEEVVSKDFRHLGSGASSRAGKLGMERIVSDLWASYPDLSVSVEGQETEGDLVRTRLTISGTDRGGGVMWYPSTGRRVSFEAEFVDRFSGGSWSSTRDRRTLRGSYGN